MLRLGTWNIHGGVGRDRRHDLGRIWTVIEAMDCAILGLQEVLIQHPASDPLLQLARAAGYRVHFAPARHGERAGERFGNLLLTRLPLIPQPSLDLSVLGREPRNLLRAEVAVGDHRLAVWVTHLGLRASERRRQARLIRQHARQAQAPSERILMGDFNEWMPGRHNLRPIHGHFLRLPTPRSFPAHRPLLALDAIWLAGDLHPVDVHQLRHPLAGIASDHLPITARIRPSFAAE